MCLSLRCGCTHACADVHAHVHVVCVAYACNKCQNVSNICVMYVRVCTCVCLYVCLYVCVRLCVCAYAALAHMLVLMCMRMCTYVLPRHVTNARMCPIFVSCMCVCVFVSACLSVCMYVCMCAGMCLWVCERALTCVYAAFTHVSMDVYYMCTIHVRPYMYVAYDGHIRAQRRAANAGGPGSQGCALAAASSALRRLHSLQLFLM